MLVFGDRASGDAQVPPITVIEVDAPNRFSFRWDYPAGEQAHEGNSLLVTFELFARGDGTLLRMTETGFREQGWEVAVLEEQYQSHVDGWDHFLPRLAAYAPTVVVRRDDRRRRRAVVGRRRPDPPLDDRPPAAGRHAGRPRR